MLPLVAVLAFALLSFSALTTDLGLAAAQQNRLEAAAEAGALAAFREEAGLRYDLATGGTIGALGCGPALTEGQCIVETAATRGVETMQRILLDPRAATVPGRVGLGPSVPSIRLEPCKVPSEPDPCWLATSDQAIPLLFGQGSLLGFQGSRLRAMLDRRAAGSVLAPGAAPVAGSLRERGVPIGGASRVEGRPVVRVGPYEAGSGLPGRAPFALDANGYADSSPVGAGTTFSIDGSLGHGLAGPDIGLAAGERLGPAALEASLRALPMPGEAYYVPLLSMDRVVVGYAFVLVRSVLGSEVVLERLPGELAAPGNASASVRMLDRGRIELLVASISDPRLSDAVPEALLRAAVLR